jgi:2-keto-4-pentenoate hydratase/2-oxohepta-3-ene-1,7-dioic acid hydratase in catechol pathway
MRYVSFRWGDGTASYGRLEGERVIDLGRVAGAPGDLKAAIAAGTLAALPGGESLLLADLTLLPVIPNPGKIFCIGLNYASHIAETGRATDKQHPAVFTRWNDTLVGHGEAVLRPIGSQRFDYEGELAVIIGKEGRRIPAARAHEHIAGYSVFQDASEREWQRHNIQFTPGKNFPATGGLGPALVTPEAAGELGTQRVQTRLNGQLVQDQAIADMIWSVAEIIEYCSGFTMLEPGDVIATGTPGGVGDKRNPPLYLKGGDTVEVSIGSIGTLTNPVVDEA